VGRAEGTGIGHFGEEEAQGRPIALCGYLKGSCSKEGVGLFFQVALTG